MNAVLATNESLTLLDISGHAAGDRAILALSRALQTNHKLQRLLWDDNGTGVPGLQAMRSALERNHSLNELQLPLGDLSLLLRAVASEQRRALLDLTGELERSAARNRGGASASGAVGGSAEAEPGSRLAQLNAGERQEIERLRTKIQSLGRRLQPDQQQTMEDAERAEEHMAALLLMKESVGQQLADVMRTHMPKGTSTLVQPLEVVRNQLVHAIVQCAADRYAKFTYTRRPSHHTSYHSTVFVEHIWKTFITLICAYARIYF